MVDWRCWLDTVTVPLTWGENMEHGPCSITHCCKCGRILEFFARDLYVRADDAAGAVLIELICGSRIGQK